MSETFSRCPWAVRELDAKYHDEEWGVPSFDDRHLFEMLTLEGAQAGLSWSTILQRREGYRQAFDGFDVNTIAFYGDQKRETLLLDPGIIRNRAKIASTVGNAQAFLKVQEEFGSFSNYLWNHVGGKPIVNGWTEMGMVPAKSELSDRLSKDMLKRGFKFVGSTIMYAFLQATGVVNDHLTTCFRYEELTRTA